MRFAPNERFGYSGEGFVYLQKVVEKITGQLINDFMEERVLKPLGMTHHGYVWKPFFDANVAQPHNEEGKAEQKGKPQQANMAYSLHTTANDYARFVTALLNSTGLNKYYKPNAQPPGSTAQTFFQLRHVGPLFLLGIRHWLGTNAHRHLFLALGRQRRFQMFYYGKRDS
jgi:CubicO group peptidase (beta-lactamase class C family)